MSTKEDRTKRWLQRQALGLPQNALRSYPCGTYGPAWLWTDEDGKHWMAIESVDGLPPEEVSQAFAEAWRREFRKT